MPIIVPGSLQTMLDTRYLFKEQMEFPSYLQQIPEMSSFHSFFSTPYLPLTWLSFKESANSWKDMLFWVVSHSGFYTQIKAAILNRSMSQRHLSCLRATVATSLLQELLKIYLILDCRRLSGCQWPDRSSGGKFCFTLMTWLQAGKES